MLYDAISVFEKMLNSEADRWQSEGSDETYTELERRTKLLVDNYIPKDGTYVLINMDRDFQCDAVLEIKYDKKSGKLQGKNDRRYNYIRYLDYNSNLIAMNKYIGTKTVMSNQMYSFIVTKNVLAISNFSKNAGKKLLTKESINRYYNTLAELEDKYSEPKDKEMYKQVIREIGNIDINTLEKIRRWIHKWFENPKEMLSQVDYNAGTGKDYIKIFFVYDDEQETKELYERENKRYIVPNIFNRNIFNIKIGDVILGLPNNNMTLNDKKTYLENKSRKIPTPRLLDINEAVLQDQFFNYLEKCATRDETNIYINFEDKIIKPVPDKSKNIPQVKSGLYFRIRNGKYGAEIIDSDVVIDLNPNLIPTFYFKEIIGDIGDKKPYKQCNKVWELAEVMDQIFFGEKLSGNYFTDSSDLSKNNINGELKNILLMYRDRIFAWLYKTPKCNMKQIISEMALKLIKNKITYGDTLEAKRQLNLMLSLEDYFCSNNEKEELMGTIQKRFKEHMDMQKEEWDFSDDDFSDEEYYYAVGQVVSYFLSLSESAKKPLSMANQFLNSSNDRFIKEKLSQMFIRYDHAIDADRDVRVKNVISHIMLYEPKGDKVMQEEMIAGLTANNAFYMKKDN